MSLYLNDAILDPTPLAIAIAQAVLSEVIPQLVVLMCEVGEPLRMRHEQRLPKTAQVAAIARGDGAKSLANRTLEKVHSSHRLAGCMRALGGQEDTIRSVFKAIYVLASRGLMPWCKAHQKKCGGVTPKNQPKDWANYTYTRTAIDLRLA